MGTLGAQIREEYRLYLPGIAETYDIRLEETNTFMYFMEDYDEYVYNKECGKSPNECLYLFAARGNIPSTKVAIRKGANDWDRGMTGAAYGGHLELIKFFISKGARKWHEGMYAAAEGGNLEIAKTPIERGADDFNEGMLKAAQGGNLDLVKFFIERGADDFDRGMTAAIGGDHGHLVKFFFEKGVTPSEWAIRRYNL